VEAALDRLAVAIAMDGYLVVALYIPPPDRFVAALTKLRRVRSGGHPWTTEEMGAAIKARGFTSLESPFGIRKPPAFRRPGMR